MPDVVSVRTLDWANSGVKDFDDAFTSDGYFVGAQNLATNGLDYRSWAIDAIGDEMPDLPQHETLDADVRVAYFYTEPLMWTRADFRTFGS